MDSQKKEKIKVTHIMSNGEVRDSLEGYNMTADDFPEIAKRIIVELARKQEKR